MLFPETERDHLFQADRHLAIEHLERAGMRTTPDGT